MACVKNAGGGPGDEDPRPPPCLTAQEKWKLVDVEVKRAAAVAVAAE